MLTYDLKNMTVLLTRPEPQLAILAQKLQAIHARVILFPMLTTTSLMDEHLKKSINDAVQQAYAIIFVSPNAVYETLHALEINPSMWSSIHIGSMGTGTQFALKQFGLKSNIQPSVQFNTQGLLEDPLLQNIHNKNIILIRGSQGSDALQQGLRNAGAIVEEIITYRQSRVEYSVSEMQNTLLDPKLNISVITSLQALENFHHHILKINLHSKMITLLVSSERLAEHARVLGFSKIIISQNAGDDAIISSLFEWVEQHDHEIQGHSL